MVVSILRKAAKKRFFLWQSPEKNSHTVETGKDAF